MKSHPTLTVSASDTCDTAEAEASFNATLKVLGDFWVLRILGCLDEKALRFCEIERVLKNSNPVTLTKRLKGLEEHGYIQRHEDEADKQAVSYSLTEKGRATLPVIDAVKAFSLQYSGQ